MVHVELYFDKLPCSAYARTTRVQIQYWILRYWILLSISLIAVLFCQLLYLDVFHISALWLVPLFLLFTVSSVLWVLLYFISCCTLSSWSNCTCYTVVNQSIIVSFIKLNSYFIWHYIEKSKVHSFIHKWLAFHSWVFLNKLIKRLIRWFTHKESNLLYSYAKYFSSFDFVFKRADLYLINLTRHMQYIVCKPVYHSEAMSA